MELKITIRHANDSSKSRKLKEFIKKKITRIERIVNRDKSPSQAIVVLDFQKLRNKAEILINSGIFKCTSTVESKDMLASIENAVDSIVKQLKKQMDKKVTSKKRKSSGLSSDDKKNKKSDIVIENASLKPMSIDEAKLQLKVSTYGFITFYDSDTGDMNVLYKNKSDKFVLITP